MKPPQKKPYQEMSLLDFQRLFPDEKSCLDYLIRMRWPEKVVCLGCGGEKLDFIRRKRAYQCRKEPIPVLAVAHTPAQVAVLILVLGVEHILVPEAGLTLAQAGLATTVLAVSLMTNGTGPILTASDTKER